MLDCPASRNRWKLVFIGITTGETTCARTNETVNKTVRPLANRCLIFILVGWSGELPRDRFHGGLNISGEFAAPERGHVLLDFMRMACAHQDAADVVVCGHKSQR